MSWQPASHEHHLGRIFVLKHGRTLLDHLGLALGFRTGNNRPRVPRTRDKREQRTERSAACSASIDAMVGLLSPTRKYRRLELQGATADPSTALGMTVSQREARSRLSGRRADGLQTGDFANFESLPPSISPRMRAIVNLRQLRSRQLRVPLRSRQPLMAQQLLNRS